MRLEFARPITRFQLYVRLTGLRHEEIATAVGVSKNLIDKIAIGWGVGYPTCKSLCEVTGGWFEVADLFGEHQPGGEGRRTRRARVWHVDTPPVPELVRSGERVGGGDGAD